MPYRVIPVVPQQIYHVFNHSIASQPIFVKQRDCQRALQTLNFYSFNRPRLRFSHYDRLTYDQKKSFIDELIKNGKRSIHILSFCLMPNHFHFLIKELSGKGITHFISNFQNSFAKYFNTKNNRKGSLFQSMFKIVRIEDDEQLVHIARYIHLNPYTSYVLKEIKELENYPWSSYPHYLGKVHYDFIFSDILLNLFSSREKLQKFTLDQADYQRKLSEIKHSILE